MTSLICSLISNALYVLEWAFLLSEGFYFGHILSHANSGADFMWSRGNMMKQLRSAPKRLSWILHIWKLCFGGEKHMKSLKTMMTLLLVRFYPHYVLYIVNFSSVHSHNFLCHYSCSSSAKFWVLFLFADMKKIIELDPSNQQAKKSLFRLEPLAAEKKEKMKEEMLGKIFR